jgi:phosphatidylinositol-bisphosphatase
MNFQMSDHKPVMALFNLKIRSVDYKQFQKTVDTASRELDILENASLPTIKISQQQLSFGQIRYGSPKICSFIIENTGTVRCKIIDL